MKYACLLLLLFLASCASDPYRYVPSQAVFSDLSEISSGNVRVSYAGMEDYQPQENLPKLRVLHLKMEVANRDEKKDWTVDPQGQSVSYANGVTTHLIASSPSTLKVKPKERKEIELYFPLPGGLTSAKDIPEFDFHWRVGAGSRVAMETTIFDRVHLSSPPDSRYPFVNGEFLPGYEMGTAWGVGQGAMG